MYNRYIPEGGRYVRISAEEPTPPPGRNRAPEPTTGHKTQTSWESSFSDSGWPDFAALLGLKKGSGQKENAGGLAGILNLLKLDRLDTGDILLLLIVLFLFLEGDNLELVITLGLMLLLGLGDDEEDE